MAGHFCELFACDWEFAAGEDWPAPAVDWTQTPGQAEAQLIPSGPDVPDDALYDATALAH